MEIFKIFQNLKKSVKRALDNETINLLLKDISRVNYSALSTLDLSNRQLYDLPEEFCILNNVVELDLKGNNLTSVPSCIMDGLEALVYLNLSNNKLKHFNFSPKCSKSLKVVNLSYNILLEFPHWILCEDSNHCLEEVYITNNSHLFDKLIFHKHKEMNIRKSVKILDISYCDFTYDKARFFVMFPELQVLRMGKCDDDDNNSNDVWSFPFAAVKETFELHCLDLTNISLAYVEPEIKIFNHLKIINLQNNDIEKLPDEFCELDSLEECYLAFNHISFLPDNIGNLRSLRILAVSYNRLTVLPESIYELTCLVELDLYYNLLYTIPKDMKSLMFVDLAQNHVDEPKNNSYLRQRKHLRKKLTANKRRDDDRRIMEPPSELHKYTDNDSLAEEYQEICYANLPEEAWDIDEYWEPGVLNPDPPEVCAVWKTNAERMIKSGNFCPSDQHVKPAEETVRRQIFRVIYGQFDDNPSDNENDSFF